MAGPFFFALQVLSDLSPSSTPTQASDVQAFGPPASTLETTLQAFTPPEPFAFPERTVQNAPMKAKKRRGPRNEPDRRKFGTPPARVTQSLSVNRSNQSQAQKRVGIQADGSKESAKPSIFQTAADVLSAATRAVKGFVATVENAKKEKDRRRIIQAWEEPDVVRGTARERKALGLVRKAGLDPTTDQGWRKILEHLDASTEARRKEAHSRALTTRGDPIADMVGELEARYFPDRPLSTQTYNRIMKDVRQIQQANFPLSDVRAMVALKMQTLWFGRYTRGMLSDPRDHLSCLVHSVVDWFSRQEFFRKPTAFDLLMTHRMSNQTKLANIRYALTSRATNSGELFNSLQWVKESATYGMSVAIFFAPRYVASVTKQWASTHEADWIRTIIPPTIDSVSSAFETLHQLNNAFTYQAGYVAGSSYTLTRNTMRMSDSVTTADQISNFLDDVFLTTEVMAVADRLDADRVASRENEDPALFTFLSLHTRALQLYERMTENAVWRLRHPDRAYVVDYCYQMVREQAVTPDRTNQLYGALDKVMRNTTSVPFYAVPLAVLMLNGAELNNTQVDAFFSLEELDIPPLVVAPPPPNVTVTYPQVVYNHTVYKPPPNVTVSYTPTEVVHNPPPSTAIVLRGPPVEKVEDPPEEDEDVIGLEDIIEVTASNGTAIQLELVEEVNVSQPVIPHVYRHPRERFTEPETTAPPTQRRREDGWIQLARMLSQMFESVRLTYLGGHMAAVCRSIDEYLTMFLVYAKLVEEEPRWEPSGLRGGLMGVFIGLVAYGMYKKFGLPFGTTVDSLSALADNAPGTPEYEAAYAALLPRSRALFWLTAAM